jgi:hypothetical protein
VADFLAAIWSTAAAHALSWSSMVLWESDG